MPVCLQVDEIYSVPDVGTVVGGTLYRWDGIVELKGASSSESFRCCFDTRRFNKLWMNLMFRVRFNLMSFAVLFLPLTLEILFTFFASFGQRRVQGGRAARCGTYRRGSFPASESGQHPQEPLGLQGTKGWTGSHSGAGKLWPVTFAQGQRSPTIELLLRAETKADGAHLSVYTKVFFSVLLVIRCSSDLKKFVLRLGWYYFNSFQFIHIALLHKKCNLSEFTRKPI